MNKVIRHSHAVYFDNEVRAHYVSHAHPVAPGELFEHRHRLIPSDVVRVSSRTWTSLPEADKAKVDAHG